MSVPAYSEYKDSEVPWLGAIPSHWKVLRIKDKFEIKKRIAGELGHDVLSITQSGLKVKDIESNDGQQAMDYSKYQFVLPGDFAMNHMDLLTGWIDISTRRGVTSPDYRVFAARDEIGTVSGYFLYVFQMAYSRRQFYPFGQGSSQFGRWRLPTDAFYSFPIPAPSRDEQTAIVTFLDRETAKIDALVVEQERLIALLKEKRQAVISHAVTKGLNRNATMKDSGIEWLGQIPAHWEACPISYRYEIALGKMLDEKRITGDCLLPYLRNTDVQWRRINSDNLPKMDFQPEEVERYSIRYGDLVVCEGGEVGRAAIWWLPEPVCYQKALHRLRARNKESDTVRFAFFIFEMSAKLGVFTAGESKATIAHLPAEKLRRYRFAFPPMEEQSEIAAHLEAVSTEWDKLEAEAHSAITLLQERRAALIAAAVTGKIDVRGLANPKEVLEAA